MKNWELPAEPMNIQPEKTPNNNELSPSYISRTEGEELQ
jgi:hypothetical protein